MSALRRLCRLLEEEGGPLAAALVVPNPHHDQPERYGALAAAGPRTSGRERDYELLVEAIREGYLLHYGTPRIVATADADLALLAGDRLYALGLARLAGLGDLAAVAELADVISLSAGAHAAGAPDLAEAVWEAGAVAVGWGPSETHERAKAAARAGEAAAAEALRAAAREARNDRPAFDRGSEPPPRAPA
jgi:hypothetical protein